MKILPLTFIIFEIFGFWRPPAWKSPLYILFYNIFTIIMFFIVFTFALSEMMGIILSVQNFDQFTENSFMFLSILSACFKASNILLKRKSLIILTNTLLSNLLKYLDEDEEEIQQKFDKTARSNTIWYTALIESSVLMVTLQSLFIDIRMKKLPFPAWLPYNYSQSNLFILPYTHQLIGNATSASLHVANDTLIIGMMLQICSQLEILKHRIKKLPDIIQDIRNERNFEEKVIRQKESEILSKVIQHHAYIYRFAKDTNIIFSIALLAQFFMAALVICSSVYQLSKMSILSSSFITLTSYLNCVLVQIFLYCWYGDAVTTQSLDISYAIFNTDLSRLRIETQRSLLIIMIRSKRPIELKTGRIFNLSILSFTKIIKASYSAFNFMQQSEKY